jgi:hypothetical protein
MRALRFVALLLLVGMALLAFIPTASTSDLARWRVVKSKSVSGQFAAAATSATLRRPRGAVRFLAYKSGQIVASRAIPQISHESFLSILGPMTRRC